MKKTALFHRILLVIIMCAIFLIITPYSANAHCDTLEGPVVLTAKEALEKGDLTPVLKWVMKEDEQEIRKLFEKTLAVRKQGKEARELADIYFFETLVRIHRAAEGASYTGLKPGEAVEPSVAAADKALETGSVEKLVQMVSEAVEHGIRKRFSHTVEAKKHADESVEAGREFVRAYVEFTHYVERIHMHATATGAHHGEMHETKGSDHRH